MQWSHSFAASTGLPGSSYAFAGYVRSVMTYLISLATLGATLFLVIGGFYYITSSGNPEKLDRAKGIIRNALTGLVIVLCAYTLTSILGHAYVGSGNTKVTPIPPLMPVEVAATNGGIVEVLVKAIEGLFQIIITSVGQPFIQALRFFTSGTPLMGDNSSVFNLWLVVAGVADSLFVIVVAILGFGVMSFASFGLEEIAIGSMLPKLGLAFLLINTSIFAVDGVISLSNAVITAILAASPDQTVWKVLSDVVTQSIGLGFVALLMMVVFLVLVVILLVYYVGRLVTLYLGAILSPLIVLLWLVPGFRDFSLTVIKTYLTTVFVLLVHVIILLLAGSIFAGLLAGGGNGQAINPVMAIVIGLATIVMLLKTQGVMQQMSYVSVGPKATRQLGRQFVNSLSFVRGKKAV